MPDPATTIASMLIRNLFPRSIISREDPDLANPSSRSAASKSAMPKRLLTSCLAGVNILKIHLNSTHPQGDAPAPKPYATAVRQKPEHIKLAEWLVHRAAKLVCGYVTQPGHLP